jgi:hypothetical protein
VPAGLPVRDPMVIRLTVGFLGNHVLTGGFYSLQYYVLNDFARILPLVRASVVLFARKTLSANDLNELIDRLVEGQFQQGDGGSHRSRSPLASRILSERNWNAGCPCAVSWHPPQCRTWRPVRSTRS